MPGRLPTMTTPDEEVQVSSQELGVEELAPGMPGSREWLKELGHSTEQIDEITQQTLDLVGTAAEQRR